MAVNPTLTFQSQFARALDAKLQELAVSPVFMDMDQMKTFIAFWAYNYAYSQFIQTTCAIEQQALDLANLKITKQTQALTAVLPALQFYGQSSLYSALTSLLSPVLFGDKGAQARAATVTVQAAI